MGSDHYRKGQALGREGLFQLVTDEVYRDGRIDARELEILRRLARFLRIDAATARAIAKISKGKFRAGLLGDERPLSDSDLFGETMAYIMSDGRVDPLEEQMVRGLRALFSIDDAADRAARAEALRRIVEWRIAAEGGSVPGEVVASKSQCFDVPTVVEEKKLQAWLEAWIAGDRSVLPEARAKMEELCSAFTEGRIKAETAVSLLFDLAPLVVDGGAGKAWQSVICRIGEKGFWQKRPALLDCLARRSLALLSRRDDEAALGEILDFYGHLAQEIPGGQGWRAWAGALRVALRGLARRGDWALHGKLFSAFEAFPPERGEVIAEDGGRACADLMEQGRAAGQWDMVWKGFEAWKVFAPHWGSESVRREYAASLDCLLEGVEKERDGEILEFEKAYGAIRELLDAYPGDASVARAFASAAPSALRIFLALEEEASLGDLLDRLAEMTKRHGANRTVAASLAVGIIELLSCRVPRQRARDEAQLADIDLDTDVFEVVLPPEDFAVVAARRILKELLQRCPESPEVKGLRTKLEQALGSY